MNFWQVVFWSFMLTSSMLEIVSKEHTTLTLWLWVVIYAMSVAALVSDYVRKFKNEEGP